jgi:hypothetical protein
MATTTVKKERKPPKKRARNLSPASQQRYELEELLANPDQEIVIPGSQPDPELLPPDILLNIQGSSAGAGSGEFHVYKAARKREFERIQRFEDEIEREGGRIQFAQEREERERLQTEKTAKNKKRRDKKKGKKMAQSDNTRDGDKAGEVRLKIPAAKTLDNSEEDHGDIEEKEAAEGLIVLEDE